MQEIQETQVRSLGQEDPLEEEMATHSFSCLGNPHGQRNLWATVHGGHKELDTTEGLARTHAKGKKNNQTGR